jgi:hypothetical protein
MLTFDMICQSHTGQLFSGTRLLLLNGGFSRTLDVGFSRIPKKDVSDDGDFFASYRDDALNVGVCEQHDSTGYIRLEPGNQRPATQSW